LGSGCELSSLGGWQVQVALVPCQKDVISSVLSGIQGDCKENGLEQIQIQNGGKDVKLLLFLVNSCAQAK
jgi:hypothetical protein